MALLLWRIAMVSGIEAISIFTRERECVYALSTHLLHH